MRAFAFILALLLAFPTRANENLFGRSVRGAWGGIVTTGSCPYGSGDICTGFTVNGVLFAPATNAVFNVAPLVLNAGASSFAQFVTSSTHGFGSDQTWVNNHLWNFNEPGIDYNVGYPSNLTLLDPTNSSNLPSGCTYYATGVSGKTASPTVYCNAVGNTTIDGFDFSNQSGHDCVTLYFGPNANGTLIVRNSHFSSCTSFSGMEITGSVDGVNSVLTVTAIRHQSATAYPTGILDTASVQNDDYSNAAVATVSIGHGVLCNGAACTGTGGVGTYAVTMQSAWAGQTLASQRFGIVLASQGGLYNSMIQTSGGTNVYIYNNVFEGYAEPTNTQCNGYPCLGAVLFTNQSSGYRVFAYNAVLNTSARPIGANHFGQTQPAYSYIRGNFVSGQTIWAFGQHGEFVYEAGGGSGVGAATIATYDWQYNVFNTPNYSGNGTAIIYGSNGFSSSGGASLTFSNFIINGNLLMSNKNTGAGNVWSDLFSGDGGEITNLTITNNYYDQTGAITCVGLGTSAAGSVTQSGNYSLLSGNSANVLPNPGYATCP